MIRLITMLLIITPPSPVHLYLSCVHYLLRINIIEANGLTHGNGPFNKTTEVDPYQYFVEAVFSEECGVYQLSQSIFLINGWNSTRKTITVSTNYIRITLLQE